LGNKHPFWGLFERERERGKKIPLERRTFDLKGE